VRRTQVVSTVPGWPYEVGRLPLIPPSYRRFLPAFASEGRPCAYRTKREICVVQTRKSRLQSIKNLEICTALFELRAMNSSKNEIKKSPAKRANILLRLLGGLRVPSFVPAIGLPSKDRRAAQLPERLSSACTSSTLRGHLRTSAYPHREPVLIGVPLELLADPT
jgi:hypothetical protein